MSARELRRLSGGGATSLSVWPPAPVAESSPTHAAGADPIGAKEFHGMRILVVQVPNSQARDAQLHRYNDLTHVFAFGEHSLNQVFQAAGAASDRFCSSI